MVKMCTGGLKTKGLHSAHRVYLCVSYTSQNNRSFSSLNCINRPIFVVEKKYVRCKI